MALLASTASSATAANASISLLNELPSIVAVGESYTIDIQVESDKVFIMAVAMPDAYYPGRGVFFHGGDRVTHDTSAVLRLTVKGKNSTAGLPQVCGWPTPETPCWPEGTAPLSVVVGVRYQGGELIVERYDFAVTVP